MHAVEKKPITLHEAAHYDLGCMLETLAHHASHVRGSSDTHMCDHSCLQFEAGVLKQLLQMAAGKIDPKAVLKVRQGKLELSFRDGHGHVFTIEPT